MKQPYLECGKIINTHGFRGAVKLENRCDSPSVLASLRRIYFCEADGKVGDLYRVERAIISAFCTGFKGQYMPPYMYEIVESANAENEEGSKNA